MTSAARLVFTSSKYDHITPLLHQVHWLEATDRFDYKLAVLVYKCLLGTAPSYLVDEFCHGSGRSRLRLLYQIFCRRLKTHLFPLTIVVTVILDILLVLLLLLLFFFIPSVGIFPRGLRKKLKKKLTNRFDTQSAQSNAGKQSWSRTALKRCNNTEIIWKRKHVSLASPELLEIL